MVKLLVLVVLVAALGSDAKSWFGTTDDDCTPASYACDQATCELPDCACPGSEPEVPLADRPQVRSSYSSSNSELIHRSSFSWFS